MTASFDIICNTAYSYTFWPICFSIPPSKAQSTSTIYPIYKTSCCNILRKGSFLLTWCVYRDLFASGTVPELWRLQPLSLKLQNKYYRLTGTLFVCLPWPKKSISPYASVGSGSVHLSGVHWSLLVSSAAMLLSWADFFLPHLQKTTLKHKIIKLDPSSLVTLFSE